MAASLDDLLARLDTLYTAVVSDCLDTLGFRSQVMDPSIRPLYPEARIVGEAFPILALNVYSVPATDHYKMELAAVDSLRPHSVPVFSRVEGTMWGELVSVAARARGAAGCIVDGYARDTRGIIQMQYPTFVRGIRCLDTLGRADVKEFDVTVTAGGVLVHPGDLIIADYDGVVVLPRQAAPEAIEMAERKVKGENQVRQLLTAGLSVTEAFARYGVI